MSAAEYDRACVEPRTAEDRLNRALDDVRIERARQDAKWGEQNHGPTVWLTVLTEEVGELAEAILTERGGSGPASHSSSMREEATQVAAVAVAFLEYLDRHASAVLGEDAGGDGR